MYCSQCGIKIDISSNYCPECGKLISGRARHLDRLKNAAAKLDNNGYAPQLQSLSVSLARRYSGKNLTDILGGSQIKTKMGNCFLVSTSQEFSLNCLDPSQAQNILISDLKLIYGIGPVTEKKLKDEGYRSIRDLVSHPRYGQQARQFLVYLEQNQPRQLTKWISRWCSCSHPHHLLVSSFCRQKDFLLLDIETMGLYNMPVILIGVARIVNGSIKVKQYLARSYEEEAAVLYLLNHNISKNTVLVTFNGRMFDVPFIRQRLYYYSLVHDLDKINLDILQFCRSFWKDRFDSYSLSSLEENLLGIQRHQDLPSYMVPQFYQQYLDNGNAGTLVPIINHNRQDLVSLAKLFSLLQKQWKKSQKL